MCLCLNKGFYQSGGRLEANICLQSVCSKCVLCKKGAVYKEQMEKVRGGTEACDI